MNYVSTRNRAHSTDAQGAILRGTAPDGGLFTWVELPGDIDTTELLLEAEKFKEG